jgi:type III pantothenate kinase
MSGKVILELDVGNTRLKWRARTSVVVGSGAESYLLGGLSQALNDISDSLSSIDVGTILVASVAGQNAAESIRCWSLNCWELEPEFAKVSEVCAGVDCGYDKIELLGIDRWLAVLAAHELSTRGALVVDCGSAITVDVLVAGRHEGGYIAPGMRLMLGSLFSDTAQVKVNFAAQDCLGPGKDTITAVNRGLLLMVVGLIERASAECKEGKGLPIFFTGGDAEVVMGLYRQANSECELYFVRDLVLDGLSLSCGSKLDAN